MATLTPATTRMLRELYRRRIRLERNERLAREAAPRSRFAYAAAATKQRSKVRQLERQLAEYGIDPDPRPTPTTQEDTSMAASTTPTTSTERHPRPRSEQDRSLTREQARQHLTASVAHNRRRLEDPQDFSTYSRTDLIADAEWRLRWLDCAPEGAWHTVAPLQDKLGVPCGDTTREYVGDGWALRAARAKRGRHQHSGAELSLGEAAAQLERMGLPLASGGCELADLEVGEPVCGMNGWGCPRASGQGDYLSDGYPSAAEARWAAERAAALMLGGTRDELAYQRVAEEYTTGQLVWATEGEQPAVVGLYRGTEEDAVYYQRPDGRHTMAAADCVEVGSVGGGGRVGQASAEPRTEPELRAELAELSEGELTSRSLGYGPAPEDYSGNADHSPPPGHPLDSAGEPEPLAEVTDGARAYAQGDNHTAPQCSCEWRDDVGDPEVGPDPYIAELDEACPVHGRQAEPGMWARREAEQRGYVLSGVTSLLSQDVGLEPGADEVSTLRMYDHAMQAVESMYPEDDGHNADRAIGRVAAAWRSLYYGPEGEPAPSEAS